MSATLYGVGVGPGDPELLTVKGWRLISGAEVIAYLCANGSDSMALEIARPFLPEKFETIAIDMPMRVEREPAMAAYDQGAARIAACLNSGKHVVFLCEGDPFFYGSFMYLYERLHKSHMVIVVPGITAITAVAAELGQPLAERDEVLKVLPATMPAEQLTAELKTAGSAAIIKVGRHFAKVKMVLGELGLCGTAVSHATTDKQTVQAVNEINEGSLPYFTTILVRHK
ncbi:MAG: precorrin-2 C(20)-methyltransferase [Aestuariivirga sp.]